MAFPLFFHDGPLEASAELRLDEETARHVVQVLRMHSGHKIDLTNGMGVSATGNISTAEKKKCTVFLENVVHHPLRAASLYLGVAFTKNASRNEWLLEKAMEFGVAKIIPLNTDRTERVHFKHERWRNILVAALIQSRQYHLAELTQPMAITDVLQRFNGTGQKIIGHCIEGFSRVPLPEALLPRQETIALIGPEGDFSQPEVEQCLSLGFKGVSLGSQRLRTETAAMSFCAYFNVINYEV